MHKTYKIKEIIRETPKSVSLILDGEINSKPGQFVMLWLPGIDEKPFAISDITNDEFRITIEEKGNFTKEISKIKPGTEVGIRGPYGHGFEIKNNSIIVAGGLGIAPLYQLIKEVKNSIIIQGAKSKKFLLYQENILKILEKNNNKIIYCTDDGSFGLHSFTTDILKRLINKKTKEIITCGPEIMIKKVFEIAEKNKINCQASLERFMRCGFGICGACVCGNQLVCQDGPVFNSAKLRKIKDFGTSAKLKSGKKVKLNEYYSWRDEK